jgi:hypothetical protein
MMVAEKLGRPEYIALPLPLNGRTCAAGNWAFDFDFGNECLVFKIVGSSQ